MKDLRAAAEGALTDEQLADCVPETASVIVERGKERGVLMTKAELRQFAAALAQPPSAEVQGLDSVRFEWWFSKEPKYEFFDQYMEGVSAGWSLDQWRTAIDAAIAAALKDTP